MMQNLQINLRNLHVCYETNSTTKLGHPFSFGLTIHSLKLTVTTHFLNKIQISRGWFCRLHPIQNKWGKIKKILW